MTTVTPFYTNSAQYLDAIRDPFHDTTDCRYGQEIRPEDRLPGHGNRYHCDECQKYSAN
jgi:hypothetical protein